MDNPHPPIFDETDEFAGMMINFRKNSEFGTSVEVNFDQTQRSKL